MAMRAWTSIVAPLAAPEMAGARAPTTWFPPTTKRAPRTYPSTQALPEYCANSETSFIHTIMPSLGSTNRHPPSVHPANRPACPAHAPLGVDPITQFCPATGAEGGTVVPKDMAFACTSRSIRVRASLWDVSFCACPGRIVGSFTRAVLSSFIGSSSQEAGRSISAASDSPFDPVWRTLTVTTPPARSAAATIISATFVSIVRVAPPAAIVTR